MAVGMSSQPLSFGWGAPDLRPPIARLEVLYDDLCDRRRCHTSMTPQSTEAGIPPACPTAETNDRTAMAPCRSIHHERHRGGPITSQSL
jgi:hypothetical protein